MNRAGFGDAGGAFGAVGGEGADVALFVGVLHGAESGRSAAGAGASDGDEAEKLDGAGDEFAVEGLRDEDGDAEVAEAVGAGQQGAVPEGEDSRAGDLVAVGGGPAFGGQCVDVAVAEGCAEDADERRREGWDDGEEEALFPGEGHEDECMRSARIRSRFPAGMEERKATAIAWRMRYVECGEIRTSVLGFGCGSVMGRVGRRDSLRAMQAAWDAGVTLFDTARSYGYGEAEGLLGEFLQGKREQATVVTKFGILPKRVSRWKRLAKPLVRGVLRVAPEMRDLVRQGIVGEMSAGHFDVGTLRSSLEESLRQLRTEYVDVLLVHEAPENVYRQDDLMAELAKVVAEGKARRVGVSSTPKVAAYAWALNVPVIQALQFPANFLGPSRWEEEHVQGRFMMVNHVFGGVVQTERVIKMLRKMREDSLVDAGLREKLEGDLRERLAEIAFGTVLEATKAHCVVTSMLKPGNVRANVTAIEAGKRFSGEEVGLLRRRLAG